MNFYQNHLPLSNNETKWYWDRCVKHFDQFPDELKDGDRELLITQSFDCFSMTSAQADKIQFIGRAYEIDPSMLALSKLRLEIMDSMSPDTQIGALLGCVNQKRKETTPYGIFASFVSMGYSVYCAITICVVDRDWASELDTAVVEIGLDEEPYIQPVIVNEDALEYVTYDDITRISYWLANFWTGIQYEIRNCPSEIHVVHQRGPISASEDISENKDRIVWIRNVVPVDELGNEIKYGPANSGRQYSKPAWGVRGHNRTLADGRVIPVRPYPKGKERNNPEFYVGREYRLVDKKIDNDVENQK